MAPRLKVLMSAYACEPGKGSEPEVGWQWALQMAHHCDLTVVTRANNRSAVEAGLADLPEHWPRPEFIYHDLPPVLLGLKQRFSAVKLYYILWQRSAWELIHHLHQARQFDLMHHVTFAAVRYPTAIWGHGAPTVWGPVGGIESIPLRLLPWKHPLSLLHESVRNSHNMIQALPFNILPTRTRASTTALASTPEMQRAFQRLGRPARLMPTIGLDPGILYPRSPEQPSGPLRLLFVGNIITLKGVDLALEALALSGTDATLTLVGSGNYLPAARDCVEKLGLGNRVEFRGRLPRDGVLQIYRDHDLFVFPSLHDTGGYAVIEAMGSGLPVICLDCGGPAVAVKEGCGIRVPLAKRGEVVRGLAGAIKAYDTSRERVVKEGKAAREVIEELYEWNRKGLEMRSVYEETVREATRQTIPGRKRPSGMGHGLNFLHGLFGFRGLVATVLCIVLLSALGFISMANLKSHADGIVKATLPGLTYAGEANASLAHAFNSTTLLLISTDPPESAKLREDIDRYSQHTTACLEAYATQMTDPRDKQLHKKWLSCREDYLRLRQQNLRVLETNREAAIAFCRQQLLPAYHEYQEIGAEVFRYNIREGRVDGQAILRVSTVTQYVVAGILIAIFGIGFFVGLFK